MELARDPSTMDFTFEKGNPSIAGNTEIVAMEPHTEMEGHEVNKLEIGTYIFNF